MTGFRENGEQIEPLRSPSEKSLSQTPDANEQRKPSGGQRRRSSLRLPRWSVRLRLTLIYGVLFILSGAALLGITYGLVHTISVVETSSNGPIAILQSSGLFPSSNQSFSGAAQAVAPAYGQVTSEPITRAPAQLKIQTNQLRAVAARLHDAQLKQLLIGSSIALAVMSVASLLLSWFVAGRVLRPLRTITTTTRAISANSLNRRLALDGPDDEMKELGDTIDGLLTRLEAAFNAQRRFVANASHELRTPLTMMRTSLDVAVGKPNHSPEVNVLADKLREGLDQADRLVEELLMLARARQHGITNLSPVSLDELALAALTSRASAIDEMKLTVRSSLDHVTVIGSETLLARMIANLVDNAVRHNVPSGFINLVTNADGNRASFVIENGGPTLDERHVELLGQPFQRLGTERTATDGSIGLGLSIVAAIVEAHDGSLAIHARSEGGLRVAIELPFDGPDDGTDGEA